MSRRDETAPRRLEPEHIPDWLMGIGFVPNDRSAPVPSEPEVVEWLTTHDGEHLTMLRRGSNVGDRRELAVEVKAERTRRRLEAAGARDLVQTGKRFFDWSGDVDEESVNIWPRRLFREDDPEHTGEAGLALEPQGRHRARQEWPGTVVRPVEAEDPRAPLGMTDDEQKQWARDYTAEQYPPEVLEELERKVRDDR